MSDQSHLSQLLEKSSPVASWRQYKKNGFEDLILVARVDSLCSWCTVS